MYPTAATGTLGNRWFMHRVVHIVLTLVMLWLAVEYGFDSSGNIAQKSYTVYSMMAATLGARGWAIFCGLGALFGLTAIFSENWRVRAASAGLLAVCHAVIAAFMMLGNPYATISGLFLANAALGFALAYSTAYVGQRISTGMASPPVSR